MFWNERRMCWEVCVIHCLKNIISYGHSFTHLLFEMDIKRCVDEQLWLFKKSHIDVGVCCSARMFVCRTNVRKIVCRYACHVQARNTHCSHIQLTIEAMIANWFTRRKRCRTRAERLRQIENQPKRGGKRRLHIDYLGTIILQIISSAVVVKWTHTSSTYAVFYPIWNLFTSHFLISSR